MAKGKGPRTDHPDSHIGSLSAAQVERLTNVMALLLIEGEPQADQLRTLACAGFSNTEIARLLGLTPNAVNVALHRMRKRA